MESQFFVFVIAKTYILLTLGSERNAVVHSSSVLPDLKISSRMRMLCFLVACFLHCILPLNCLFSSSGRSLNSTSDKFTKALSIQYTFCFFLPKNRSKILKNSFDYSPACDIMGL